MMELFKEHLNRFFLIALNHCQFLKRGIAELRKMQGLFIRRSHSGLNLIQLEFSCPER